MSQHEFFLVRRTCLVLLASAFHAVAANGQCATCDGPRFDDAERLLAAQGFTVADHRILVAWDETVATEPKTIVRGVRIAPRAGAVAMDLYFDEAGRILRDSELRAL
ncbi:MAG: hypothetical protein RBU21_23385, partial [FCB group bacterium]|nr:hypothetical protein [FCB group bacterium]